MLTNLKDALVSVTKDLLEYNDSDDNFIKIIVIGDEYNLGIKGPVFSVEDLEDQKRQNRNEAQSRPCSQLSLIRRL